MEVMTEWISPAETSLDVHLHGAFVSTRPQNATAMTMGDEAASL